jgi:hypothetical protein
MGKEGVGEKRQLKVRGEEGEEEERNFIWKVALYDIIYDIIYDIT